MLSSPLRYILPLFTFFLCLFFPWWKDTVRADLCPLIYVTNKEEGWASHQSYVWRRDSSPLWSSSSSIYLVAQLSARTTRTSPTLYRTIYRSSLFWAGALLRVWMIALSLSATRCSHSSLWRKYTLSSTYKVVESFAASPFSHDLSTSKLVSDVALFLSSNPDLIFPTRCPDLRRRRRRRSRRVRVRVTSLGAHENNNTHLLWLSSTSFPAFNPISTHRCTSSCHDDPRL